MSGLDSFLRPEVIWCLIAFVFIFAEFVIPGLVIIFFAVGAFITALAQLYYGDLSINVQLIIFLVSSVLSLLILRRFLGGIFLGRRANEPDKVRDIDSFVGHEAIALESFNPGERGKVELHGTNWTAVCAEPVEKGQVLMVSGQENLVLYVGPKKLSS